MKIDLRRIAEALENRNANGWYLDRKTGDVFAIHEDFGETEEETVNLVESEPERFLTIDPLDSRDGFVIMEDFVETLPMGEAKRSLAHALSSPNPFESFRRSLHDLPDERRVWFQFETDLMLENAREFLRSKQVDFDWNRHAGTPIPSPPCHSTDIPRSATCTTSILHR